MVFLKIYTHNVTKLLFTGFEFQLSTVIWDGVWMMHASLLLFIHFLCIAVYSLKVLGHFFSFIYQQSLEHSKANWNYEFGWNFPEVVIYQFPVYFHVLSIFFLFKLDFLCFGWMGGGLYFLFIHCLMSLLSPKTEWMICISC